MGKHLGPGGARECGENIRGKCLDPMQDYKFPHAVTAVVI